MYIHIRIGLYLSHVDFIAGSENGIQNDIFFRGGGGFMYSFLFTLLSHWSKIEVYFCMI